jgi:hypothetical protein
LSAAFFEQHFLRKENIKMKSIIAIAVLLNLCACASVDTSVPTDPSVAVEREYTTGSMLPQKKSKRNSDVKTVNSDDLITMPRAATPTDPMGRK